MTTIERMQAKYKGIMNPDKSFFIASVRPAPGSKEEKWYYLTEEGHGCMCKYKEFSICRGMELLFEELGIPFDENYKRMKLPEIKDSGLLTSDEYDFLGAMFAAGFVHATEPTCTTWYMITNTKSGGILAFWIIFVFVAAIIQAAIDLS